MVNTGKQVVNSISLQFDLDLMIAGVLVEFVVSKIEPMDVIGKTKEDASLPKGLFEFMTHVFIYNLSYVCLIFVNIYQAFTFLFSFSDLILWLIT